jgi:hypothetical protein
MTISISPEATEAAHATRSHMQRQRRADAAQILYSFGRTLGKAELSGIQQQGLWSIAVASGEIANK